MPKNVMKLVKPSPHRARNDFDLSHRHIMSMNFGELIPATTIETVPGDHIEMHAADLIRAIPFVTSPFLRAKQHIDVWFVPYKDLWHQFDNFITKKAQPVSSAMQGFAYCPHVSVYNIWSAINDRASYLDTDIVGLDLEEGATRLLNYLGYGFELTGSAATMPKVNLWRLAAYNYIWYNEYRQSYYDDGTHLLDSGTNVANLFNFDNLACTSEATANVGAAMQTADKKLLAAMCQMRYRTWKKDLYTGLLPSTQFGAVSTIGLNLDILGDFYLHASDSVLSQSDGMRNLVVAGPAATYQDTGDVYLNGAPSVNNAVKAKLGVKNAITGLGENLATSDPSNPASIDVLSLRKSEAIQIWRENALRAGNRVKDNMRAHYGIESDFRDHRPTYLGSVSAPLNIGDVMTTANSTFEGNVNPNTTVGDIAGKGLSSLDEKVFKYDAKDFGVIMAIASILPEAEYNAQGISRPNQLLECEDYFIPEFENLGLEAVSSLNFMETAVSAVQILGYAPRYYAYKTKLDKCYDTLMTSGVDAPWCSPKYDVTAALISGANVLPLSTLYVNPKVFDVNFSSSVAVTCQFKADFYFDVDAVRPMSVLGLPFS